MLQQGNEVTEAQLEETKAVAPDMTTAGFRQGPRGILNIINMGGG
jgi:hypothetical protein